MVMRWRFKGIKSIKPPAISDSSLNLRLDFLSEPKFQAEFNEKCLKTESADINCKNLNLYITYETSCN